jgi:excisionase family DNA binding protein
MFTSPNGAAAARATGRDAHQRAHERAGPDQSRLLTINEVAEWLGVSRAWVYDHVSRKKPFLPCVRFGEVTRFRREEIERFIQEHAKPNGTA